MTHTNTHNKRKVRLILVALLATIVIITGSIFAFFSDVVTHNTTITAGTLDLVKDTTVITQNGVDITTLGNQDGVVDNFNPGDVVTFSVPVENKGSKSAWLRGNLTLTGTAITANDVSGTDKTDFSDHFVVFSGTVAQSAAADAVGKSTDLSTLTGWTFADGTSATFVDPIPGVINGDKNKADFEAEKLVADGGTVPTGRTIYNGGVDENKETLTYTIYFKPTGLNKWQGKTVIINYKAEAMQYRNNATPSWTNLETK